MIKEQAQKFIPQKLKTPKRKFVAVFSALFIVGCLLLLLKGSDAVTLGKDSKAAILTTDEIQLAFEFVGGRVVEKRVIEEQYVKKGEVLVILDSRDVDLSILALEAQIAEVDLLISQTSDSISLGYDKVGTSENKRMTEIYRQKAQVDAMAATEENEKRNYERMTSLYSMGGISKSNFDNATTSYEISVRNTIQQKQILNALMEGASDSEKAGIYQSTSAGTIYLSDMDQSRRSLANESIGVERLRRQKDQLLVKLESLKVQKDRLILRAPTDGKITKVLIKEGEVVDPNAPVLQLQTEDYYYDIYVAEDQVVGLKPGDTVVGRGVALDQNISGKVRFINKASGFASIPMSRERGQGDLAAFQVRIYTDPVEKLLPGMTIEVDLNELLSR